MKCPLNSGPTAIGSKWTVTILKELKLYGVIHFNELLRKINGLTPKLLSKRLKELEQSSIVSREESGNVVNYKMTERGIDVQKLLDSIIRVHSEWGDMPDCRNVSCTDCRLLTK